MSDIHPVPPELLADWPDLATVRSQILAAYSLQTGSQFSTPPTEEELESVVTWLNKNADTFLPHYFRRRQVQVPVFSPTLSSKISGLAQFHCPICDTKVGQFPVETIPIRISPVSKQAIGKKPKLRAAFERAIRHRFSGRAASFSPDQSICLLIVFVVSKKGAQKDLDNMAKAIIDATKSVLFGDDRQIDHLNIIRIKAPPGEEYIYLNLRQTTLNQHHDVLAPRLLHSWAGATPLELKVFLATASDDA
jgi:Holliday junction resolvase RusA-like endonuclease